MVINKSNKTTQLIKIVTYKVVDIHHRKSSLDFIITYTWY